MAVWFMRRLQCLPCEQFTLLHTEIATAAGRVRTSTNDCLNNVLRARERAHALKYGDAID
jgi:hypothetical protein